MHPDIAAARKAQALEKVVDVALKHSDENAELEQLASGEAGPGVDEVRHAVALEKLAQLVDELFTTKTTKKSSASSSKKASSKKSDS